MKFNTKKIIPAVLITISIVFANGGWRLPIQLFAWTKMVISYSETLPLKEAVVITLSGKKPCNMCHTIKNSKSNTKLSAFSFIDFNLSAITVSQFKLEKPQQLLSHNFSYLNQTSVWQNSPTAPPPRS